MSMRDQIAKAIAGRIKAWHASPHDFDRVDLSKIGTGQGAQSYGPGFYAAESPKVSGVGGEYWKEFARGMSEDYRPPHEYREKVAIDYLLDAGGDRNAAIKALEQANKNAGRSPQTDARMEAIELLQSDKHVGPRVYELDIKADPKSFLQWDKPLAEQQHLGAMPRLMGAAHEEAYQRALASTDRKRSNELWDLVKNPQQATGEFAWRGMASRGRDEQAMKALQDTGVPGIRYADARTRALGVEDPNQLAAITAEIAKLRAGGFNLRASELDQTRAALERTAAIPRTYNYVINDPSIIDITKKYGIPGALGAAVTPEAIEALSGVAAQDQYR